MTPKKTYPGYYSIIRYIHEVEHGEFVNIGVILFCAETIEVKDHGKDFCNLIKFMQTRANQIEFSDLRGVVISDDIINEMGRIFIRTVT